MTQIYMNQIICTVCNPNTAYSLNEEVWLADSNSGGYIEVGYQTSWEHYGQRWYFYANTPPGQGQRKFPIMQIPQGDFQNYSGFKLTRNNQAADKIVVQIWSATNSRLFGTVETNNMGGAYGTSGAWTGNRVDVGSELRGINYDSSVVQSSNGNVSFGQNQWQSNDGVYHFQKSNGFRTQNTPEQAYWYGNVLPSAHSTGGLLYTYCGC